MVYVVVVNAMRYYLTKDVNKAEVLLEKYNNEYDFAELIEITEQELTEDAVLVL